MDQLLSVIVTIIENLSGSNHCIENMHILNMAPTDINSGLVAKERHPAIATYYF